ncbi:PREDICTED: uncharacterized protein LOC106818319 [Priapulus caudatus]|uniref:Uncharacterized protein LOC106818319 n=1 Tax=Priapulus caudatus TaxID=37621 RepID=A0ABM1F285_PRICU|nr:PREDICTED: uncharacterized protein LOC106818319 [Priapulus caudatus]
MNFVSRDLIRPSMDLYTRWQLSILTVIAFLVCNVKTANAIICGPFICDGVGAYCCDGGTRCCWYTWYSLWWTWGMIFMLFMLLSVCMGCCYRRRYYYTREYIVAHDVNTVPVYGTIQPPPAGYQWSPAPGVAQPPPYAAQDARKQPPSYNPGFQNA